ncbi:MAG: hypothetical protein ACFE9R_07655 [Candidatus Hermodarchaeota archaeon]
MDYALMFNVLEGGVSEPIKWGKQNLQPDRNIIIMDEGSSCLFLWYGAKQGLVARRTALRQAESLKGHGYSVGKSIVGRDIKELKEIDERKIGRDPETSNLNEQLQEILNRDYKELDNYIVTFDVKGGVASFTKPIAAPKTMPEPPSPTMKSNIPPSEPLMPTKAEPVVKAQPVVQKKEMIPASEYDVKPEISPINSPEVTVPQKAVEKEVELPKITVKSIADLAMQAKIGFVFVSILNFFDDIWISKKPDGMYSVEHMDGKVCEFTVEEGKIKFSPNSFSGVSNTIKTDIQKKFVELSKLL